MSASTKKTTKQNWLDTGYRHFATEGPDKLSINKLSKDLGAARATFYYHFLNKDELIGKLLDYHISIIEKYKQELEDINNLFPDLYMLLYRYLSSLKFHQQLLFNCHIPIFKTLYYEANKVCIQMLLPHIKTHFGFHQPDDEVFDFYNTLTDAWYTRLDASNTNAEKMANLAEEIAENVLALHNKKGFVKRS